MNEERILKYLSDLMNEAEKSEFERELSTNEMLRAEYEKIKNGLNELKFVPKTDETYFRNLPVNIRERISRKKKKKYYRTFVATAAFTVLILFFILPQNNKDNSELLQTNFDFTYNIDQINEEIYSNTSLDEIAEGFSLDRYLSNLSKNVSPEEVEEYLDEEYAGIPADLILENLQISDTEIERIYNELKKEKFL
jgi:hypothetical protein